MNTKHQRAARPVVLAYVGLALTALAAVLPLLARDLLEDHLRAGYPAYSRAQLATATLAWQTTLGVIGVLGVIGWVVTIVVVRRQRHARWVTTLIGTLGLAISLTAALIRDTSGEVGLAPPFGILLMLPCVVGGFVVASVWKGNR